ncbi:hypothetical protein [Sorangium sp. So ce1151]|uniref:hypothetical protein n=1 Tax=Sorangium sp. So ce1151 TaxID=3133332 RepID=UPI003F611E30
MFEVNCWLGQKAAQLAQRLDAIREGDGTVLDHSVMVYMSEMRTHDHDAYDLPIVASFGDDLRGSRTRCWRRSCGERAITTCDQRAITTCDQRAINVG